MTLDTPLIVAALGLMLVIEGLVLALMAGRIDEMLRLMASLSVESRRTIGLVAVAAGTGLIWLAGGLQG